MNARALLLTLSAVAPASLLFALAVGSTPIAWIDLWGALSGHAQSLPEDIVLELRLPRALCGFAVGGTLALAGALMQVLLRNPLADPYVLGISGGAAFAALVALLSGATGLWLTGSAFLGALASMLAVFALSHGRGGWTQSRLLLTGIVLAAGWGALISFVLAVAPNANLKGMLFWLMGDLSYAERPGAAFAVLAAGLALALFLARDLNVLARGETQAAALGVNTQRLHYCLYVLSSLLTAAAVTLAGSVGFVGLIVPHFVRLIAGNDQRVLLPAAVLLGGSLVVVADTLARTVIAPLQLPVGILTALLGVPAFLYLLHRGRGM